MISFAGDLMCVHFDRFDLDAYQMFLRCKRLPESHTIYHPEDETYSIEAPARFAGLLGVEKPRPAAQDLPLSPFLYDDQTAIVRMFLEAKRFACWSGCGLGKTIIGLEGARHIIHRTGGRVLIVTMNEIVPQWIREAQQFYGDALPVLRLESRAQMRDWMQNGASGVAITNYEKWNPTSLADQEVSEARHLAGIILDESSRLKTGGGKQKWALIKSTKGIEYKLSLTATPAPNDTMEFASQASFLEKMRTEQDIIWTFFTRDPKSHRWTVKPNAREAFFRFMASWSIYVRDPRRYGWRLDVPQPPEPEITIHEIEATPEQIEAQRTLVTDSAGQGNLWPVDDTNAIQRNKLSQLAKGFLYLKGPNAEKRKGGRKIRVIPSLKPEFIARLAAREVQSSGLQVLVWTVFDAESDILADHLAMELPLSAFDLLTGKTSESDRLDLLEDFRLGRLQVLISRASMLGYGMNLQHVGSMIFSGWNDSYESYYQALRRAYRHGQKRRLRVHIPIIPELEADQWENICRKESRHQESIDEMEKNYIEAIREICA